MIKKIFQKSPRLTAGYSLFEMALAIAVLGIMFQVGITLYEHKLERDHTVKTAENTEMIQQALRNYMAKNHRLPLPAAPDAKIDTPAFGVEYAGALPASMSRFANTAGDFVVTGTIPVRTLNLPDNVISDGWKHRYVYAVSEKSTVTATFDPNGDGAITLKDPNGNALTQAKAVYALISLGKDERGAYDENGSRAVLCDQSCQYTIPGAGSPSPHETNTWENLDGDDTFVATTQRGYGTSRFTPTLAFMANNLKTGTPATPTYHWNTTPAAACTVTMCNSVSLSGAVTCVSDSTGAVVADSFCNAAIKPATPVNTCTDTCGWVPDPWGPCTGSCNLSTGIPPGSQSRTVNCVSAGFGTIADTYCDPTTKPSVAQSCPWDPNDINSGCFTYAWFAPAYNTCPVTCGGATQTRPVYCQRTEVGGGSGSVTFVADSFCDPATRPSDTQTCGTNACVAAPGSACDVDLYVLGDNLAESTPESDWQRAFATYLVGKVSTHATLTSLNKFYGVGEFWIDPLQTGDPSYAGATFKDHQFSTSTASAFTAIGAWPYDNDTPTCTGSMSGCTSGVWTEGGLYNAISAVATGTYVPGATNSSASPLWPTQGNKFLVVIGNKQGSYLTKSPGVVRGELMARGIKQINVDMNYANAAMQTNSIATGGTSLSVPDINALLPEDAAQTVADSIAALVPAACTVVYTYHWDAGAYGACSATCGTGTQYRNVVCRRNDNVIVPDSNCTDPRPESTQSCTANQTCSCPISTAANASKLDVYFLADNTSSMDVYLNTIKSIAGSLFTDMNGGDPRFAGVDARFGVGAVWGDPSEPVSTPSALSTAATVAGFNIPADKTFINLQSITSSQAAMTNAMSAWSSSLSGGDAPEGQFVALEALGSDNLNDGIAPSAYLANITSPALGDPTKIADWRPDAVSVVIIISDASSLGSYYGGAHTETVSYNQTLSALQDKRVVISLTGARTLLNEDSVIKPLAIATGGDEYKLVKEFRMHPYACETVWTWYDQFGNHPYNTGNCPAGTFLTAYDRIYADQAEVKNAILSTIYTHVVNSCNGEQNSYHWVLGNWGACTGGSQTRTVECQKVSDNSVVSDSLCITAKPSTTQSCP